MAGLAARVRLLACRLHALPSLGGTRGLAAFVEKSARRAFRRSSRFALGFDHGAGASARGGRAKKNGPEQALGRSRGGFSTKIHAATLDENLDPDNVLEFAALDRGYDADRIRERLAADGIEPVIPPMSTRSQKPPCDKELYLGRNRIERFFNKLK